MQMGTDLARGADQTAGVPIRVSGVDGVPLRSCPCCVWFASGMEECDAPENGMQCKCFAPSAEATEQARALIEKLQMAYRLHLTHRGGKRLPWMESTIDRLRHYIENRRP